MVRNKALAAVAAAAVTVVVGVAVPSGSATAGARPAAKRLGVSNAGFEYRPAWRSSRVGAVVTRTLTPRSGRYSGLLYARSAGAATMTPVRPLVAQSVVGTTYTLSMWVSSNGRGNVPADVQLVELRDGRVVASSTVRTTATTRYRKVATSLTAHYTGSVVTIRVRAALHRKQGLRVDDIYLSGRPAAPKVATTPTTNTPGPTTSTPSPTPPSTSLPTTAFGTTAQPRGGTLADAVARQDAKFGHLATLRYYAPGLPPAWSTITALGQRDLVVSFKADPASVLRGDADSYLRSWFAAAPRDRRIWWTYFHEPENDVAAGAFTPTQFRDAFRRVAALAEQAGRQDLQTTMILMGYTVTESSGRNWLDYYPGGDVVDVLGWDVYNHAAAAGTSYSTPENVFGKVVAVSAAAGKPVAIAETGAPLILGDSGSQRAAYLKAAAAYLRAARAAFVTYYDSTQGGAYTLEDSASVAAWAAQM